jgi:hypothetical protein
MKTKVEFHISIGDEVALDSGNGRVDALKVDRDGLHWAHVERVVANGAVTSRWLRVCELTIL